MILFYNKLANNFLLSKCLIYERVMNIKLYFSVLSVLNCHLSTELKKPIGNQKKDNLHYKIIV